jgi:hypothetical protein
MGRVSKVLEPDPQTGVPSLETDYTYDGLGNLTTVVQVGKVGTTPQGFPSSYREASQERGFYL